MTNEELVTLIANEKNFTIDDEAIESLLKYYNEWTKKATTWDHDRCLFVFSGFNEKNQKENHYFSPPRIIAISNGHNSKRDMLQTFCDIVGVSKDDVLARSVVIFSNLIKEEKEKLEKKKLLLQEQQDREKLEDEMGLIKTEVGLKISKDDYELGKYKTSQDFPELFTLLSFEANENKKIANILRACAKNTDNVSNAFDTIDIYIDEIDKIGLGISNKVAGIGFSANSDEQYIKIFDKNKNELSEVAIQNADLKHYSNYICSTSIEFRKSCFEKMSSFVESNSYTEWCKKNPTQQMVRTQKIKDVKNFAFVSAIAIASVLSIISFF